MDKSIGELILATNVSEQDLFVLEQSGTAKKMTGQIFTNWLVERINTYGGIKSIEKTGTSGIVDEYTITYVSTYFGPEGDPDDPPELERTDTFYVTNGKAISTITQYWAVSASNSVVPSTWYTTLQTMTSSNRYLWGYTHYAFNDGSSLDPTKSVIGVYGDTGQAWYVHIKYASHYPTADTDMDDSPGAWIGIYSGTSSSAPTSYTAYTWYQYKGDTGDPATLQNPAVSYQASIDGGPNIPSGTWFDTVPYVAPGSYLWTRVILTFNTGNPVTYYTVSRYGVDGQGSAGTAVPLADTTSGAVGTSTSFSREDHRHPLPTATDIMTSRSQTAELSSLLTYEPIYVSGTIQSSNMTISDAKIKAGMKVLDCRFGTKKNINSRSLDYTTTDGQITFSGSISDSTNVYLILVKTN